MRNKQNSDNKTHSNTRKTWKPEEIAELIELYEADIKTADIATHLGRTPKAVYDRISLVRGQVKAKPRKTPKPSKKSELSDDWVDTYADLQNTHFSTMTDDWDAVRNIGKKSKTPEPITIKPKKLALTLKPEQSNSGQSVKNNTHWVIPKQLVTFCIIAIIVAITAYTIGYTSK